MCFSVFFRYSRYARTLRHTWSNALRIHWKLMEQSLKIEPICASKSLFRRLAAPRQPCGASKLVQGAPRLLQVGSSLLQEGPRTAPRRLRIPTSCPRPPPDRFLGTSKTAVRWAPRLHLHVRSLLGHPGSCQGAYRRSKRSRDIDSKGRQPQR